MMENMRQKVESTAVVFIILAVSASPKAPVTVEQGQE